MSTPCAQATKPETNKSFTDFVSVFGVIQNMRTYEARKIAKTIANRLLKIQRHGGVSGSVQDVAFLLILLYPHIFEKYKNCEGYITREKSTV